MSYLTVNELKVYLGEDGTANDALLTSLIASAQAAIDSFTRRAFEVSADTTRYFSAGEDTVGRVLHLDRDLCQITEIVTDADGTPVTLAATDYTTRPRNEPPYWQIELKSASPGWKDVIEVTGRWGYSLTPPADVVQAARRLAAYFYRQKDSQVFETTAVPEQGVVYIPRSIPKDIQALLAPYVRPDL